MSNNYGAFLAGKASASENRYAPSLPISNVQEWLSGQWVLHNPTTSQFQEKDRRFTSDVMLAKVYASAEDAKREAANEYMPCRLSRFLMSKPHDQCRDA